MDVSYTDVNKNTFKIVDDKIQYLHKGVLKCEADVNKIVILYFNKRNSFGAGQLCVQFPNMKKSIVISARNESCDQLEYLYNILSQSSDKKIQKSLYSAISYKTEEQVKQENQFKENKKREKERLENVRHEDREKRKEHNRELKKYTDAVERIERNNKVVRCPKCKSTSIQYTNKKLSLGRAIVGDLVAGPAGTVLGGLSSKKGYAVCLNCGKKWRI